MHKKNQFHFAVLLTIIFISILFVQILLAKEAYIVDETENITVLSTIIDETEEATVSSTTSSEIESTSTEQVIEKTAMETTTRQMTETTVETTTSKIEYEKDYSDSDVYLLAQILYCEAGGCSKSEMAKVGQVVLNRMNTDYWEFSDCDTIYEVLCQGNSYPTTLRKIRNGIVPSESAKQVAKGLLEGSIDSGLSDNVLWQTGFKPFWNATVVQKTEWHYYSVLTV